MIKDEAICVGAHEPNTFSCAHFSALSKPRDVNAAIRAAGTKELENVGPALQSSKHCHFSPYFPEGCWFENFDGDGPIVLHPGSGKHMAILASSKIAVNQVAIAPLPLDRRALDAFLVGSSGISLMGARDDKAIFL